MRKTYHPPVSDQLGGCYVRCPHCLSTCCEDVDPVNDYGEVNEGVLTCDRCGKAMRIEAHKGGWRTVGMITRADALYLIGQGSRVREEDILNPGDLTPQYVVSTTTGHDGEPRHRTKRRHVWGDAVIHAPDHG